MIGSAAPLPGRRCVLFLQNVHLLLRVGKELPLCPLGHCGRCCFHLRKPEGQETVAGAPDGNDTAIDTIAEVMAYGGQAGGSGGRLVKVGSGTLPLNGMGTYTVGTTCPPRGQEMPPSDE